MPNPRRSRISFFNPCSSAFISPAWAAANNGRIAAILAVSSGMFRASSTNNSGVRNSRSQKTICWALAFRGFKIISIHQTPNHRPIFVSLRFFRLYQVR